MKEDDRYAYAKLGLVFGTALSGAFFMMLYAATGNAQWIPFIGIGPALGLILGAAVDRYKS